MKLLDQVRHVLRVRHYSYRTEQCSVPLQLPRRHNADGDR
jgi:hypothetical protein